MLEEELIREFENITSDLNEWGKMVDEILIKLITSPTFKYGDIQIFPKYRVKGVESFINKALYRQKNYDDPMIQIEDKIGTRVIVLTTDIVDQVCKAIREYPNWYMRVSKDKKDIYEDTPDKFSYQSMHFIVWPKNMDSFKSKKNEYLKCEIQVRTLLQHAYAEVSHDNVYKGPYKNDLNILRKLAKSMALMETADDFFCNIFNTISNPQTTEAMLSEYLIKKFEEIIGTTFTQECLDRKLTENVFSLLKEKPVTTQDIDEFLSNNSSITENIKFGDSLLCKQPVIILIAYYLNNHRTFIEEKWEIDQDVFNKLKRILGYTTD